MDRHIHGARSTITAPGSFQTCHHDKSQRVWGWLCISKSITATITVPIEIIILGQSLEIKMSLTDHVIT
jgi:hypothetical protein